MGYPLVWQRGCTWRGCNEERIISCISCPPDMQLTVTRVICPPLFQKQRQRCRYCKAVHIVPANIDIVLCQCCSTVYDGGSTLTHHRVNVSWADSDRGATLNPPPPLGILMVVIFEASEYGPIEIRLFTFKL